MKLSETLSGLLALMLGLVVIAYSRTFPPMPGQPVGPSLFPAVIGIGLVLFGGTLALKDMRTRSAPWITFEEWVRRPRMLFNFTLVIAAVLFYAAAVERLGFFITAVAFLSSLFLAFGVKRTRIVVLAAAVTLALHYGFYTLLRVPLPWGLLGGVAW